MQVTFIHTADWQIGKPFHNVENEKREVLRSERIHAISRIASVIKENGVEFVLVAGDLFDSPTPTKPTVSATCSAIGALKVPVYVIPGNHDHGGAGSVWEQDFFLREKNALAPNLQILLKSEPVILEKAILFPCPLLRRHEPSDLTSWLRNFDWSSLPDNKVRIILSHGSVMDFGSAKDEDEPDELFSTNFIDISKLPFEQFEYLALGDWHGTKKVGEKAWYSGTHESDRFFKGDDYNPGNVLLVNGERGKSPLVKLISTGAIKWMEKEYRLSNDHALEAIEQEWISLFESRVNRDLLKLTLTGSLGLEAQKNLEQMLESLTARLIRLKLSNRVEITPTDEEMELLVQNHGNPLLSEVAGQLFNKISSSDEDAAVARVALKELYLSFKSVEL